MIPVSHRLYAPPSVTDHAHWHGAVSIHVNFGAAGMIIVEDADNQLPVEFDPRVMDDYIVAIYYT